MKLSADKDVACLVRQMVRAGWSWERGKRHGKLKSPQGRKIAIPGTPSDHRALKNLKSDIARMQREEQ